MKLIHKIKYSLIIALLVLMACEKEDGSEEIFVYFPTETISIVENSGAEIEIPIKVFSDENLNRDIELNYTLEGNEEGRLHDNGNGVIQIEGGFSAYIAHISLTPVDNDDSDGDAEITINLESPDSNVNIGLGESNLNSSILVNVLDDDISCLAELWTGTLNCADGIWPSWSPTYCSGERIDGSCTSVKVTFDFWQMGSLETTLELELGDVHPTTKQGSVTLLNDVNVVGDGYDLTFHKGDAGTFDANTFELNLSITFTGYDIGSDKYIFTIKK